MEQKESRQRLLVDPLRGMDERQEASPNRARMVRDMGWHDDAWHEAGGFQPVIVNETDGEITNPFTTNAEHIIQSLHWFSRHSGGRHYLVWDDDDGNLRQFIGNKALPWSNIVNADHSELDGRHVAGMPWVGTQSSPFGGRLYLINGYDEACVFNGRFCDHAGYTVDAPLPEYKTVDRTGNDDPLYLTDPFGLGYSNSIGGTYKSGYRYLVTFVNERGQESPASDQQGNLVDFINSNKTQRNVVWVGLPVGGSSTVARRIYRTQSVYGSDDELLSLGAGENYYFLKEIQDNETTHYWDHTPDISLGSLLDVNSLGPWPTSSKLISSFKNTVFLAGTTVSGRIRFSAPGKPEEFPVLNYFDLNDDIAGPITAMYPTKNALVAFKARGIFLIKGNPVQGFFSETLSRNVGCASQNTLSELPGKGVMFLDPVGQIHLLEGALTNTGNPTRTIRLSTPIPRQVSRINNAAVANARGVFDRVNNEYQLSVPTLGSIYNDLQIVYHFEIGEWSIREGIPVSAAVSVGDHRGYVIFGSHDTSSNPGLYVQNWGYPTKNGTALSTRYETADISLNSVFSSAMPLSCYLYALGYGSNQVNLNVVYNRSMSAYYDASTTESGAADRGHAQQRVEDNTLPHLGVTSGDGAFTWDTSTWVEHRVVPIRFDISSLNTAPVTEMRVRVEPAERRIELRTILLELHGARQRGVVLLNDDYGPSSR